MHSGHLPHDIHVCTASPQSQHSTTTVRAVDNTCSRASELSSRNSHDSMSKALDTTSEWIAVACHQTWRHLGTPCVSLCLPKRVPGTPKRNHHYSLFPASAKCMLHARRSANYKLPDVRVTVVSRCVQLCCTQLLRVQMSAGIDQSLYVILQPCCRC